MRAWRQCIIGCFLMRHMVNIHGHYSHKYRRRRLNKEKEDNIFVRKPRAKEYQHKRNKGKKSMSEAGVVKVTPTEPNVREGLTLRASAPLSRTDQKGPIVRTTSTTAPSRAPFTTRPRPRPPEAPTSRPIASSTRSPTDIRSTGPSISPIQQQSPLIAPSTTVTDRITATYLPNISKESAMPLSNIIDVADLTSHHICSVIRHVFQMSAAFVQMEDVNCVAVSIGSDASQIIYETSTTFSRSSLVPSRKDIQQLLCSALQPPTVGPLIKKIGMLFQNPYAETKAIDCLAASLSIAPSTAPSSMSPTMQALQPTVLALVDKWMSQTLTAPSPNPVDVKSNPIIHPNSGDFAARHGTNRKNSQSKKSKGKGRNRSSSSSKKRKDPTPSPSLTPTKLPTKSPTKSPTESPTKSPTQRPTKSPTGSPTNPPTFEPTLAPTRLPTARPTKQTKSKSSTSSSSKKQSDPTPKKSSSKQEDMPAASSSREPAISPTKAKAIQPSKKSSKKQLEATIAPTSLRQSSSSSKARENNKKANKNSVKGSKENTAAMEPAPAPTASPTKPSVAATTSAPVIIPVSKAPSISSLTASPTVVSTALPPPPAPSVAPIQSPTATPTEPTTSAPIVPTTPFPTPTSGTVVPATPFAVEYTQPVMMPTASDTTISPQDFAEAQELTCNHIEQFIQEVFNLTEFVILQDISCTAFATIDTNPSRIDYDTVIVFNDTSEFIPLQEDIDDLVSVAFLEPEVEELITDLNALPSSNPLSSTTNVEYDIGSIRIGLRDDHSQAPTISMAVVLVCLVVLGFARVMRVAKQTKQPKIMMRKRPATPSSEYSMPGHSYRSSKETDFVLAKVDSSS